LLVVIAIIGILVALLLPAIQAAREAARRIQCSQQLAQSIIAVHNYQTAFGVYPPGTLEKQGPIQNHAKGYHHGWITQILPYMEQKNAFNHLDRTVGVYDKKNAPVRGLTIDMLICPSQAAATQGYSSYAAVHHDVEAPIDVNNNGVFFLNSRVMYEDITDGSAYTLFIGEKIIEPGDLGWMSGTRATLRNTGTPLNVTGKVGNRWNWAQSGIGWEDGSGSYAIGPDGYMGYLDEGMSEFDEDVGQPGLDEDLPSESSEEDAPDQPQPPGPVLPIGGFASVHPGGCQFAFGDGHVNFLTETIPPATLQQLGHRADGKLLDQTY
jgi:prepilin-type processing-associated H-X9-DG protein